MEMSITILHFRRPQFNSRVSSAYLPKNVNSEYLLVFLFGFGFDSGNSY